MAHVITIAIEKGGTAKTTTTVNLAALAAASGKKVLLVDLDAQANATFMLSGVKKTEGVYAGKGIFDMFRFYDEDMNVKKFISPTRIENLDMIPSNAQTPRAVDQLKILSEVNTISEYKFLAFILANISDDYDFIFIDTPPARDALTSSAIYVADDVIMPCLTDEYSIDGLETTVKMIETIKQEELIEINILGILLTRIEKTSVAELTREELMESDFGPLVFKTEIRKSAAVNESTKMATPVVIYNKRSNPAVDYTNLWAEMLDKMEV